MDIGVARSRSNALPVVGTSGLADDPPAATFGDAGLFLDVNVDELASVRSLDAPDDLPALAVEVRETADSVPGQDGSSICSPAWGAWPRAWRTSLRCRRTTRLPSPLSSHGLA